MRISLQALGTGSSVLAGKQAGQRVFTKLVEATAEPPQTPQALFLDFTGVEVATASFLRESILAFRDHIRGRRSHYYPVVANANETVQDELLELLRSRGGALMACTLSGNDTVTEPMLVGELEPKQRMTFDLVAKHGETDAGQLMRDHADTRHATAWNNRLSSLAALGLVMEVAQGRSKRYRRLFGGA
jgi:hypothetical protein